MQLKLSLVWLIQRLWWVWQDGNLFWLHTLLHKLRCRIFVTENYHKTELIPWLTRHLPCLFDHFAASLTNSVQVINFFFHLRTGWSGLFVWFLTQFFVSTNFFFVGRLFMTLLKFYMCILFSHWLGYPSTGNLINFFSFDVYFLLDLVYTHV